MELLIATKNTGKVRELQEMLNDLPIELVDLENFKNISEPEETGVTFAENAALKAGYYAQRTGKISLADDSGLEVEALGGEPGVFSARYGGGKNFTFAEKNIYLLNKLKNAHGSTNRRARFVCSMAIADETGAIIFLADGICNGTIAETPRGANGFGYDPIFIPEGFSETFGELPGEIKQKISHRSRAIEKIIRFLRDFSAL